jgi:hypothetical protein
MTRGRAADGAVGVPRATTAPGAQVARRRATVAAPAPRAQRPGLRATPLRQGDGEPACRRDSVRHRCRCRGGHPSDAAYPEAALRRTGRPCLLLGLAPSGGCQPPESPRTLVRSYRTVSPLPVTSAPAMHLPIGGLFSVARSGRSPHPGSRQRCALRSPDLPRHGPIARPCRGHPADSPSASILLRRRPPPAPRHEGYASSHCQPTAPLRRWYAQRRE